MFAVSAGISCGGCRAEPELKIFGIPFVGLPVYCTASH